MAKQPYPSETADRYIIRFPDGMRDQIKALAAANGRSMNSQIIQMLQYVLEEADVPDPALIEQVGEKAAIRTFLQSEILKKKKMLEHIFADYESGVFDLDTDEK